MDAAGYALFETPVGRCAVAWNGDGICGLLLPDASDAATLARTARRFPLSRSMPASPEAQDASYQVQALLRGEPNDLRSIRLDMRGVPEFNRRVYELARRIPPGHTWTYGDLARRLGGPALSRAVGRALGRNPFAIIVPCHRVVAASGRTGGFSAPGGTDTKHRLLALEGATITGARLPFERATQ